MVPRNVTEIAKPRVIQEMPLIIKTGIFATISDLPIPSMSNNGEIAVVLDNNEWLKWNGKHWTPL